MSQYPITPDLLNETEYLFREGKVFRRTINQEMIGHQETILASLVEPPPILTKNLATWNNRPVGAIQGGNKGGEWAVLFTELPSLPIKIHMHLNKEGTMLAPKTGDDFYGSNKPTPGAVTIRDPWTPPAHLRIFFFVQFSSNGLELRQQNCYVYFKATTGEFLTPFYPNVHDNGRICMGHDYSNQITAPGYQKLSLFDQFVKAHTSFHASETNADLVRAGHISLLRKSVAADGTHSWFHPEGLNPYGMMASTVWMPHLKGI